MNRFWWSVCAALAASSAFGAQLLKDINAVPRYLSSESSSFREGVTVAGGTLFTVSELQHGSELWITDGTPAGTRLLRDIRPGPQLQHPRA